LKDVDCALAKKYLFRYSSKQAWHVLETSTPFHTLAGTLKRFAIIWKAVTSGEIRNLLINMPRRYI